MKILLDQNLPMGLVERLVVAGYDAAHTSSVGLEKATDPEIFDVCRAEDRVLITADKRLTRFLAATRAANPSVVVVRGFTRSGHLAKSLLPNLPLIEQAIAERGAAVFSLLPDKPIRVELLPLGLVR